MGIEDESEDEDEDEDGEEEEMSDDGSFASVDDLDGMFPLRDRSLIDFYIYAR